MHKIIYTSKNNIPWEVQSAFKLTNYYTENEDRMTFCYMRMFVCDGAFKACTYCFEKEPLGNNALELCFNLNPETSGRYLQMRFGVDGIDSAEIICPDGDATTAVTPIVAKDFISYHTHAANDQQGYYWCGEISLSADAVAELFGTSLCEKSILLLNFYKIFEDSSDHASLFPDSENDKLKKSNFMQEFVVLKY